MALVRPFRAVMYRHEPGQDLSDLAAPPYDVITPEQRADLVAGNPENVVQLELPDGPLDSSAPGNRYETGRATWQRWLRDGILIADESPAIYVIEQSWEHDGRHVRRRAFVAAVGLRPYADGVVLPHERTLPKALSDRLDLTRATAANLSQVFGLFSDPAGETDALFERAMTVDPMFRAADAEGVTSTVWAIRDHESIEAIAEIIDDRPIFIADGHHRYSTALAYRDERRLEAQAAGQAVEEPAYDSVMMALVNMDDPDLVVLPTHRLVRAEGAFDATEFWSALSEHFEIAEMPDDAHPAGVLEAAERPTFIVRTGDGTTRVARLRTGVDPATAIPGDHSPAWKHLDVAVLQELILRPIFGIHPDRPESLERLSFAKDAHRALRAEGADVAFILRATRMEQLRAVALNGEMMPQKSTYFYPKLLSGLLFKRLD